VASSQLPVAGKDAALAESALWPLQKQTPSGTKKPKSLLARWGTAEQAAEKVGKADPSRAEARSG
jgi:hypothetical protein